MKVDVKINSTSKILKDHGLDKNGKVQMFHTQNILRRIQKYMPYRHGDLIKLMIASTNIREPKIVVPGPTAKYLYYGYAMEGTAPKRVTNRELNYTKTKNANAGPLWDKRLIAAEKKAIAAETENYARRG